MRNTKTGNVTLLILLALTLETSSASFAEISENIVLDRLMALPIEKLVYALTIPEIWERK